MTKQKTILLILIISFLTAGLTAQTEVAPELTASSALLMDFDSGRILYEKNSQVRISPASMTKVMTLLLCYDALAAGELKREDIITIDEAGSSFSRPPFSSLMLLEEGQEVSVLGIMKGLAISSGNDAAYAIAHILGPGKRAFVDKMNARARSIGMKSTVFVDPDGWSEYNLVTAEDYALLAREYISLYPEALNELHSQLFMVYPLPENMPEGREFRIQVPRKKKNTNLLLGRVGGVDGLKTGYIDESGFNFTGTALRDGQRIISIIMGVFTDSYYQGIRLRAEESEKLINYGFYNYHYRSLPGIDFDEIRVWYGNSQFVQPVLSEVDEIVLGDDELLQVTSNVTLQDEIHAPLAVNAVIGSVDYYLGSVLLTSADVILPQGLEKGAWYKRIRDFLILSWQDMRARFS
ncbi:MULTISPECIES: D-alanyl-D-alanine carboxypeptidase family protein [unclassified Oceanispirochaeta]|uniref:D-alanyl-D-alanine carboxypeptidase family protein n=1 Tax=unclassified Oceanispirochaeta TaxID=2635722 RepID=UPI000E08FD27|nr:MULTISPECIES: D-alanyl-D-alanine carboxypeptidase family protein [unclassified Oceanispirochaeta]MBF9016049.1 D-alanyl-D-alanine carboxypeptidase [Oceanispirochaeta sp. M2]NPD72512.1 D-alanyl-D-alanine carboxypeptidase [Oceanispirochaeta sp. M1]RDG31970.1 D-alanyl-D-alanine carboxypeptidase [Oceanispirochaeta sp. M1]